MANTLTSLANVLFAAGRKVPRELTGVIGACTRDFNDQGASKGDTVKIGVVPAMTSGAYTPAQTFTAGTSRTIANKTLQLNNESYVSWNWTAEDERQMMTTGLMNGLTQQTFEQAFRAIGNEIESYAWLKARAAASRALGTAGTAPFASTINILNSTLQLFLDNGSPTDDLALVCSTNASTNLRNLTNLQKVNEAGTDSILRNGELGKLSRFAIRESAAIIPVAIGGGTSYVSDSSGDLAVGTTSIPIDVGSGTVLAGDVVTFTGDTNKYVVTTGVTAAGTIVIAEPGLRKALPNDTAMTIGALASANIAMHRSGLVTVVRPGLQPAGGAIETQTVTDPETQLSYLVTRAVGDGMASYYVRCVYDCFAPNPFAIHQLLG